MQAGISTACFYPEHTEKTLETLCSHNVRSIEVFANCEMEIEGGYARSLRAMADAAGSSIVSLHPYTSGMEPMLFFTQYDRRFQQGRDTYKRYYGAAAIMGAGIVVFHGGIKGMIPDFDLYFERFGILMEDARRMGVELCHENVFRCVGHSPDFFRALAKAHPEAKFVFDLKQAIRSGCDVMEFAEALGERICHIHFSDNDENHDCLTPSRGTFNTPKFLSMIRENGFDGSVIVELYRNNFHDIVEIIDGYQHILHQISTYT